mmetsp:Transcript_119636/g.381777  ORF Transcript_119636/g.381777 Transcript_119636/m.381777 type:complete len:266 (-) Transcript_119636:501-1298(-)
MRRPSRGSGSGTAICWLAEEPEQRMGANVGGTSRLHDEFCAQLNAPTPELHEGPRNQPVQDFRAGEVAQERAQGEEAPRCQPPAVGQRHTPDLLQVGYDLPDLANIFWVPGVVPPVPPKRTTVHPMANVLWPLNFGQHQAVAQEQLSDRPREARQEHERNQAAKALAEHGELLDAEAPPDGLAITRDGVGTEVLHVVGLLFGRPTSQSLRGHARGAASTPRVHEHHLVLSKCAPQPTVLAIRRPGGRNAQSGRQAKQHGEVESLR